MSGFIKKRGARKHGRANFETTCDDEGPNNKQNTQ